MNNNPVLCGVSGLFNCVKREPIERPITATDRQIDQLVYELYGLTEKEVKTVEEGANT
jgi:hypothetical protein